MSTPRLFLAPMAGVTDLPFRLICAEMGAEAAVTEMVSAKALYYGNRGTQELMKRAPGETCLGLQLFGSDPEIMAAMAERVEADYNFIDINMGCPMPKIVNNGEGSALMKDPELAARIVKAVAERIHRPLTVKMRKGFDQEHVNAPELAARLEQAGAAAIFVHGRTRSEYYSGRADWQIIREVKRSVSVPVIGNGDVCSADDALRLLTESGCDAVMVGRGAQGNPWLFREIAAALKGQPIPPRPEREEMAALMARHARLEVEEKGDRVGYRELRKHLAWYTAGMTGGAALRKEASELTDAEGLERFLRHFLAAGTSSIK